MEENEENENCIETGFLSSLKAEWKLLWTSLKHSSTSSESVFGSANNERRLSLVEALNDEDGLIERSIYGKDSTGYRVKALCHARQKLYQMQEELKREIDLVQAQVSRNKSLGRTIIDHDIYLDQLLDEGLALHRQINSLSGEIDNLRFHNSSSADIAVLR